MYISKSSKLMSIVNSYPSSISESLCDSSVSAKWLMKVRYVCNNCRLVFFNTLVSRWLSFAGVSNWGGYAIACALYILSTCEIHDRYLRKAVGFPQLLKMVWLSALPSVTKVISRGPGSCELLMGRWNQPLNRAQSLLSHGLLVTLGNSWLTSIHTVFRLSGKGFRTVCM